MKMGGLWKIAAVLSCGVATGAGAQTAIKYQHPPQAIETLLDAAPSPVAVISPNHSILAIEQPATFPTIAEVAQPRLRLAGLRFNPRTNGLSRVLYAVGLSLQPVSGGASRPVSGLPSRSKIEYLRWAPDGKHLAFVQRDESETAAGLHLYVVDIATARARRLGTVRLNGVLGAPCNWMPDSKGLLCRVVPAERGAAPVSNGVPAGPNVSENLGRVTPGRTYEDLLKTPEDERTFAYYGSAKVAVVSLDGKVRTIGGAAMIETAEPSPDGRYALVVERHPPFSYALPVDFFPKKAAIVDLATGAVVKQIADEPLADSPGAREFQWRADKPATVVWVQPNDGGDPAVVTPVRDRILSLPAPFTGEQQTVAELPMRYRDVTWGNDHIAIIEERRWKDRKRVLMALDPSTKQTGTLYEGSSQDLYNDPGIPMTVPNASGYPVLHLTEDESGIYFDGLGASPKGDMPFIAKMSVKDGKERRVWQSAAPYYAVPTAVLAEDNFLVRRESETEPPNYFVTSGAEYKAVTHFASPYAATKLPTKQVLHYKRADGLELTANLWLPAGYDKSQGPLPTLMEAYPAEFKTRGAAGQVSGSPYRFPRIGWFSPVFFTATGYAVLENASIPIVGEGDKEPNDTYVEQLVAGAKAAIDYGASLGVVDPKRVAVMGHSYGAFMTANLLAHSDMFRAGIARSGAYNRTLTPYGFQAEERTYWQAPEIYHAMSPFSYADKIKTPILLIHGEADDNQGTFPIQTERFYAALKGQGATVRMVFLPLEAHSYEAHESLDHMLWEMNRWLDTYVKPEKPVAAQAQPVAARGRE
jgi:dipeptidyl aminopeptidase/acylaminoacyl peptidase